MANLSSLLFLSHLCMDMSSSCWSTLRPMMRKLEPRLSSWEHGQLAPFLMYSVSFFRSFFLSTPCFNTFFFFCAAISFRSPFSFFTSLIFILRAEGKKSREILSLMNFYFIQNGDIYTQILMCNFVSPILLPSTSRGYGISSVCKNSSGLCACKEAASLHLP